MQQPKSNLARKAFTKKNNSRIHSVSFLYSCTENPINNSLKISTLFNHSAYLDSCMDNTLWSLQLSHLRTIHMKLAAGTDTQIYHLLTSFNHVLKIVQFNRAYH